MAFLPRWRRALYLTLLLAAATRGSCEYLSMPRPLTVELITKRLPATIINIQMGPVSDYFNVMQTGFWGEAGTEFPNCETFVETSFDDPRSGIRVIADWHPCNPHLFDGSPFALILGGRGCTDATTSGGALSLFPMTGQEQDAAEVQWVLAGSNNAACSVDMERLLADGGQLLRAVENLRDNLAVEFSDSQMIAAPTETQADGQVAFLGSDGDVLTVASPEHATWLRQVKAAFQDSYKAPSNDANRRVTFLVLDFILKSPEFRQEVEFVLGKKF